ncbi:hypothetical protein [Halodesulfovibrio sp.]|jgi:hypothetical protein|uniref:hypothetical protein n=1 Tax=Halodesulfovibrio sp. TaxID=1912772 RepID=UPI0025D1247D|nr:hypothetical protein [Halodesulfovibrio sp.]MCT4627956.1 hypothetical protein [Halodesulfovibrio sp.]
MTLSTPSLPKTKADTSYDSELMKLSHYQKYPNMIPWIGEYYSSFSPKIFVIGESHYLDKGDTYHHAAEDWYAGIPIEKRANKGWYSTREIIGSNVEKIANNGKWRLKSHSIYRNIDSALKEFIPALTYTPSAFTHIAFMNYFQRPAQVTGDSIKVTELDRKISYDVCLTVAKQLRPDLIVFTSSLAFRTAKKSGFINELADNGALVGAVPHPSCPWWYRKNKKGLTGKEKFKNYLDQGRGLFICFLFLFSNPFSRSIKMGGGIVYGFFHAF